MAGAYAEYDSRVIYSAEEGTLDLPRNPLYRNRFAPITDRVQGISLDADRGVYLAGQVIPHHDLTSSGSDEDYDFLRYELEAEEYIPFRHGYQVLAFREFMSVSQSLGEGDNIPFYMMDYIGGGSTIRGFDGFRFRDRNLAVANAEYRWEAWFRMDAALFVDAGYAFRDFDEFAFNEIETGYGFGFRFRSSRSVVARIDFAWSREGFSTYLKLGAFL
jgi:outer membrane protein assembly factor BamA